MEILKIRTENAQAAYNRICGELREVSDRALGPNATRKDIDLYNNLHGQVKRRHPDGTIGHLHLKREVLLFDERIVLEAPSKKVPFRLKPGKS